MASQAIIPKKLDWVAKRAECTLARVFNELCDGIEEDVTAANIARELRPDQAFVAQLFTSGTSIAVGRHGAVPRIRVIVGIVEDRIDVVYEPSNGRWGARIGLNDEGRCILKLVEDGTPLEQWQFRKRALEDLFFGSLISI
jgi:hypothetical protein